MKNIFKRKGKIKAMKIKKRFIFGTIIILLLMSFAACSEKEDPIDVDNTGSAEGVTIAYLTWFSEEKFSEIETMIEEADSVGDIYLVQSKQPPKNTLEMIESQHEFIIHFYGEDAWENVEYNLEEMESDMDNIKIEGDAESDLLVKEFRVDLVFNNMPHHLMGYENIHFTLSNESGPWIIKEGLSWEKNIYDGKPAPEYYKGIETLYRGVDGSSQPEDLFSLLGEPINQEETDEYGYLSYTLEYEDASYYFTEAFDEYGSLDNYALEFIIVNSGNYNLPREIKLGDSFYSVMKKFPRDKDWLLDEYNCFYGTNTLDGFGGACYTYEDEEENIFDTVILVPTDYVPYFKMEFTNGVLESAMLVYMHMM